MPVFELEKDGKTFEVEAPDIQSAASAFQNFQPQRPAQPQAQPNMTAGPQKPVSQGGSGYGFPAQEPLQPGYQKALQERQLVESQIAASQGAGVRGAAGQGNLLGFGDEVEGLAKAAKTGLQNLTGNGPGYSMRDAYKATVDAARAQQAAFAQQHPGQAMGAALAGGVLTPGMGAAGRFVGGAPGLASAVGRSAVVGGGIGAAAGAGNADGDLADRAKGAALGAAVGAPLGAAAPVVARGVGAAVNAGANAIRPSAVPGVSKKAAGILADLVDPATAQRLQQLGPEAMLVDAGPSAVGVAQGVATRPGVARDQLVAALTARNQGANARLAQDVEGAIGPNVVPSQVEAGFQQARRALSPQYEAALDGAAPVDLSDAVTTLATEAANAKGPIASALQNVRGMLMVRDPATGAVAMDTSPRGALATRQALDDMIAGADGNERRILTQIRGHVSGALGNAAPNIRALDQQYGSLARQSEALQTGQQLLDSGRTAVRPAELTDMMAANAPETNQALRQGTRAEIDRLTGTKANDLVALRNVVKGEGDWNRARLAQVFGQAEADRVLGAVDREAAFASAYNRLVNNSETASRQGGARFLEEQGARIPLETPQTAMGAGLYAAKRLANAVLGSRNSASMDRLAAELGPMLTVRGADRDALIRQLLAGQARRAANSQAGDESRRLSELVLQLAPRASGAALGGQSTRPAESRAGS